MNEAILVTGRADELCGEDGWSSERALASERRDDGTGPNC